MGGLVERQINLVHMSLLKTVKVIDFVPQYLKMMKNLNIEVMLFVGKLSRVELSGNI